MIERYFIKGATFRWAPPAAVSNQTKDGSIVVNPAGAPAPMVYTGQSPKIAEDGIVHLTHLGLNPNMVVQYSWLSYVLGRTAKISTPGDVMTGFMSGCWITTWTEGGQRWVGHVGTVESAGKNDPPNSTVKSTFRAAMGRDVRGYNPANAFAVPDIQTACTKVGTFNPKIVSLVTSSNQFFAVLFIGIGNNTWVCGGKKEVAGDGYDGVANALR